jgi:hypothetical protein
MAADDANSFREKLILLLVVAEFILTEVLLVVTFKGHDGIASIAGSFNAVATCFVATVPASGGLAGYFLVRKDFSGRAEFRTVASRISSLFLGVVAGAYASIIMVAMILMKSPGAP